MKMKEIIRKVLALVLAGTLMGGLAGMATGESVEMAETRMDPAEEIREMEGMEPAEMLQEDETAAELPEENDAGASAEPVETGDPAEEAASEAVVDGTAEEPAPDAEAQAAAEEAASASEAGAAPEGPVTGSEAEASLAGESMDPAGKDQEEAEKRVETDAAFEVHEGVETETAGNDPTVPGSSADSYEYEKKEDGTLVLNEKGDPVAILREGQDVPTGWQRDEAGALVLDRNGNPIVTKTAPASDADIRLRQEEETGETRERELSVEEEPSDDGQTERMEMEPVSEAAEAVAEEKVADDESTERTGMETVSETTEVFAEKKGSDDEQTELIEMELVPEAAEAVREEAEMTAETIEIIVTEMEVEEAGSNDGGEKNETALEAEASEMTVDGNAGEDAVSEMLEADAAETETEKEADIVDEIRETEETDGIDETGMESEADPAGEADENPEEETSKRERKAVLHSSADGCIMAGETIQLVLDLNEFADCEEVIVVWEVNRGDGWAEAGIGEIFSYTATAESLGWEIQARVQYREGRTDQPGGQE